MQGPDEETASPLIKLEENRESGMRISYPDNIEDIDHWITFSAMKRTKPWRGEAEISKRLCSIILPVPQSLSTGYKVDYNGEGIGASGEALAKGGEVFKNWRDIPNLIKEINAGSPAFSIASFRQSLLKGGAMALNEIVRTTQSLTNLAGGVQFGAGLVINPHKAMLFNGVNFRSHSFSYHLAAQNEKESFVIRELLYRFKYHSSPSFSENLQGEFFEYPDEFDIEFHHPEYLFEIAPSVLTSMSVNYHPQGQPVYFQDTHAPVSVELKLDFTELTITTKENIGPLHNSGNINIRGR